MNFINKIKKLFLKESLDYEEKLLKKYSSVDDFKGNIKILFISDTHGDLSLNKKLQNKILKAKFDICCILGDIHDYDYEFILNNISKENIVALLGNHDRKTLIDEKGVKNLNGNIININGIKIGGIQGCHTYKEEFCPSFTHEESIGFLDRLDKVDILISHDKPFTYDYKDNVHDGLKGITYYLYKNNVPYNVHGHLHNTDLLILKNGSKSIGIYGCEVLSFNSNGCLRENGDKV